MFDFGNKSIAEKAVMIGVGIAVIGNTVVNILNMRDIKSLKANNASTSGVDDNNNGGESNENN